MSYMVVKRKKKVNKTIKKNMMSESDILVNFEIWVKRQPTNRVPRGSHVYYIHVIWYDILTIYFTI